MGNRPAPSPTVPVYLSVILAGEADKAARHFKVPLSRYVADAVAEKLERDRLAFKAALFHKHELEAQQGNTLPPDPVKYGLPPDYGLPSPSPG